MPLILECLNPVQPLLDPRKNEVAVGTPIRAWLLERFPGFLEFEHPTVCMLNGEPLLRKDWDYKLQEDDIVAFISQPGGPLLPYLWYLIVAVVVGVAVSLLMPKPKYDSSEAESVYSIRGQQNRVRLGDAIEVPYGKCRLWPSYGSLPYNRYIGNEQWQYALFCLGQGTYDIHKIQIEDTEIVNYKEVSYAVYAPGEAVTLFDDRVTTSTEVSNIELLGPNETGYDGWTGPFTANEAGTTVTRLEVDIVQPMGLYTTTSKGKLRNFSVSVVCDYRQIDDAGEPVGDWTIFFMRTWTMCTATAQRETIAATVASGRYQVRMHRTSTKDTTTGTANLIQWGALRAFLPSVRTYAGQTMMAVKMRATNNLNDQSAFRINVWATRKLPIWNAETGWSAPTATRSIIWALCDVLRSTYGGQLSDSYLPLTDFVAMDAAFTAQGRYFDYVFDQKSTVWDAARTIARIGRAVPMIEGSLINLVRDTERTLPTMLFNQNNIHEGTFKWRISLPKDGDYDGVRIYYTDPDDFQENYVDCLIGDDGTPILAPREGHDEDDVGDNLEEVKLLGCTDRNWAYREGCYYRASKRKIRQTISFQTGLEGHLPKFGSLIGVSHDLPRWALGGSILAVAGDSRTLTLSEPVTFAVGPTHVIGFRLKDGTSSDPLTCTAGTDEFHVMLAADAPASLLVSDTTEPPQFLFGTSSNWCKQCVVSNVTPDGEDSVTIEAYTYDGSVFDNDTATAPASPEDSSPATTPDIPVLSCSSVSLNWAPGSNTTGIATWAITDGAMKYEVWTSTDGGTSWVNRGFTDVPSFQFPVNDGTVLLRIRPIGKGVGEWCESSHEMTEAADPWDDGDSYSDGIPPDILYPPTSSLDVTCQTRGGTATLIGYDEFTSPSTPPKKYLVKTLDGTLDGTSWSLGYGCSGPPAGSFTVVYSGSCFYSATTGALTENGIATITSTNPSDNSVFPTCNGYNDGCGVTVTLTPTVRSVTSNGGCCNGYQTDEVHSGSGTVTLSSEDTEDNAITRLLSDAVWADATCESASAVWTIRVTGFSFTYVEERVVVTGQGYLAGWEYIIEVTFGRREAGTADAFVALSTEEYSVVSDSTTGGFELTVEVPNSRGWETKLLDVEVIG